jgi:hypothetical protein
VREARFKFNEDGPGMAACTIRHHHGRTAPAVRSGQPDFATQAASNNLIFRIPTPVFGAGLSEQIPDSLILANQAAARH